jgi:hypothetical protein
MKNLRKDSCLEGDAWLMLSASIGNVLKGHVEESKWERNVQVMESVTLDYHVDIIESGHITLNVLLRDR